MQRTVFYKFLIKDVVIADGEVIMELDWDGHRNSIFDGSESFAPHNARWVPYCELDALRPPIPDVELAMRTSGAIYRQHSAFALRSS